MIFCHGVRLACAHLPRNVIVYTMCAQEEYGHEHDPQCTN